ncbi:hypothetical protein JCM9140_3936 [Halalkalibacter wakoensis JCM 9140]|uniref:Dynamin N-terminal domain-containing protein n=1 Tax=Halalkalibacter wakoensis JCM 9140 TaxID=1236970 RepID=W4Q6Z4_9BACI|nr:hypothetical protein JCM9140_3936 [Halalkalibacter wakoensis JCM 9140]
MALSKWKELMSGHEEYKLILKDISAIQQDLQEPPIVMIAGEFKAGKSTFINAWLGEKILTADVTPATAVVTKLTYGKTKKVIGHFKNGETKEYDEQWLEQLTAEREGRFGFVRKQLSHIELKLPVEKLQHVTIVDSPGLNATIDHHTDATEMFLHRADKMIWLFNYQFFGTSTEVAELKKINELGITPVGVVNRIDLHDEEEEELSEFLDGERRKFRSLISGLTGVSALEALEGKLENNDTKLKWSNWAEVEKIFETLKAEDNKPQRMFERLKKPLQQLDQLWINKKADAGFYELQPLVYSFFDHDLPRVLKDREQIEEKLLQMDQQFSIVEEAISSLSNTESFEELTQSSHSHGIDLSKKNWEDKVQFKVEDISGCYQSIMTASEN